MTYNLYHLYRFDRNGNEHKRFCLCAETLPAIERKLSQNKCSNWVLMKNRSLFKTSEGISDDLVEKAKAAELADIKDKSIRCAIDLFYGQNVIDKIMSAQTENEVYRIMADARRGA